MDTTVGEIEAEELKRLRQNTASQWGTLYIIQNHVEDVRDLLKAATVFGLTPYVVGQLAREAHKRSVDLIEILGKKMGELE